MVRMLRVTIDTNARDHMERIRAACEGLAVEIAPTTISLRESGTLPPNPDVVQETGVWDESTYDGSVHGPGPPVYETAVLGEWMLGFAVLGDEAAPERLEAILKVFSDGAFPKERARETLSHGERNQLRDAMILEAHARERRDVLVSDDRRAFIGRDGEKRRRLEALCATQVRTVDEFCDQACSLAARAA
jgi:hypothetical protein